jgi:predicted permease
MSELLLLALAIFASAGAGIYSRSQRPVAAELLSNRLIRLVLWVVLPPSVFVNVANFEIASSAGLGLLVGLACLVMGGALAWAVSSRLALPPRVAGAVICSSIVANTGYFGLPATLIVFGSTAVSGAAAWDALVTGPVTFLAGFAVGAFYGEESGGGSRSRVNAFLRRNPVLWVLPFALLTPSSAIPSWALTASHVAFVALLPVGFYVLGVNLAGERGESDEGSLAVPITVAASIRLLFIPIMFAAVCAIVGGIPHSYYIQASAPVGINALIVASLFGLDRRLTAGVIAVTTVVAIFGVFAIGALG